jgi:hypothetical protein
MIGALLERTAAPLDVARRATLRLLLRSRAAGAVLSRRDRRLAFIVSVHAVVAFALAVYLPLLLLVLGPVLLGVAHVAADVRHLVLRRELPRWWKAAVAVGCALLIALRVVDVRGASIVRLEMATVAVWLVVAVVSGADVAGSRARALVGLVVVGALGAVAVRWPHATWFAFVHVHNLVALAIWLVLFRKKLSAIAIPAGIITLGAVLLLSGAMVPVTWQVGNRELFGVHLLNTVDWIAPMVSTRLGIALVTSFAFLQSVHYLVWLVAIPQDDVRGEGTPTFRMSARAWMRDFGSWGMLAIALAAGAVLAGALVDVLRTRALYLSLAMFHGYMELALLAYFLARGRAR